MARLVCFILIFAVFLVFIFLNFGNNSDVNLGFRSFVNVPVYISAMVSFFLGMIFTIPIIFSFKNKNKEKRQAKPKKEKPGKKNNNPESPQEEIQRVKEPYGID